MDYLMVLRLIAIFIIIAFFCFAASDRFSFTYLSPTRRYRYQRRDPDTDGDGEFVTRGSSWFLRPILKHVTTLPPRIHSEPQRRIIDSKTNCVCWDSTLD